MRGFFELLSVPIIYSGTGEVTQDGTGNLLGPLRHRPALKLHCSPDFQEPQFSLEDHSDSVGHPELVLVHGQCPVVLEMPFLSCTATQEEDISLFGGRLTDSQRDFLAV